MGRRVVVVCMCMYVFQGSKDDSSIDVRNNYDIHLSKTL